MTGVGARGRLVRSAFRSPVARCGSGRPGSGWEEGRRRRGSDNDRTALPSGPTATVSE